MKKIVMSLSLLLALLLLAACGRTVVVELPDTEGSQGHSLFDAPGPSVPEDCRIELVIGDDGYWYEVGYDPAGYKCYVMGFVLYPNEFCDTLSRESSDEYRATEDFIGIPAVKHGEMVWASFDANGDPGYVLSFDGTDCNESETELLIRSGETPPSDKLYDIIYTHEFQYDEQNRPISQLESKYIYSFEPSQVREYYYTYYEDRMSYSFCLEDDSMKEENWFNYKESPDGLVQRKTRISSKNTDLYYFTVRLLDTQGHVIALTRGEYYTGNKTTGWRPVHTTEAWTYSYDENGRLSGAKRCFNTLEFDSLEELEDYMPWLAQEPMYLSFLVDRDETGLALRLREEEFGWGGFVCNPMFYHVIEPGVPAELPGFGTVTLSSIEFADELRDPEGGGAVSYRGAYCCYAELLFENRSGRPIEPAEIEGEIGENFLTRYENGRRRGASSASWKFFDESSIRERDTRRFFLYSSSYSLEEAGSYSGLSFHMFDKYTLVTEEPEIVHGYYVFH